MKYRDLIFVLALVALGVLWWSGPQSVASEAQESPTVIAAEAPTQQASPQPTVATPIEKGEIRMERADLPRPALTLSVKNQATELQDLVISAKLVSTEPASVYIRQDTGRPEVVLTASFGERYWHFRSDGDNRNTAPQSVKELSWDVKLSELVEPDGIDELRSLYKSQELNWVMTVTEAEEETNPMTRRVIWPIMGGFTTTP